MELLQELDQHPNAAPWLLVCSFVNPHDISCDGMFTQPIPGHDTGFQFNIDESLDPPIPQVIIPNSEKPDDHYLFDSAFQVSLEDNLTTKPRAQTELPQYLPCLDESCPGTCTAFSLLLPAPQERR